MNVRKDVISDLRCNYFKQGACDGADIPMSEFDAKKRHMTRCARYAEIDWSATAKSNDTGRETEIGDVILDIDALKKYYQVSANALFSSAQNVW